MSEQEEVKRAANLLRRATLLLSQCGIEDATKFKQVRDFIEDANRILISLSGEAQLYHKVIDNTIELLEEGKSREFVIGTLRQFVALNALAQEGKD